MFIVDLLWKQDNRQKQQHFLVRNKEPLFGLAVQHLDLDVFRMTRDIIIVGWN